MGKSQLNRVSEDSHRILQAWLASCRRRGKISRNTVAVGIVVLDHLRRKCPVSREDVISAGGEVSGTRSGLARVLAPYGIPSTYLKEATTRQVHQDGQRLLDELDWGRHLSNLAPDQRDNLLSEMIANLAAYARQWLERQSLKLSIDRAQAPAAWISLILENAKERSGGIVEQHLVGAKLEERFKGFPVPNYPAHAADRQTEREGDFSLSGLVYHVTAVPSRSVLQKCASNMKAGRHPVLLVPRENEQKARVLAQDEGIERQLTILSIEDFVGLNIIELATQEKREFFTVLREIVQTYNRRLAQVETDLSLQIEVR